jgi:REP element-mobilizing transposase RayT
VFLYALKKALEKYNFKLYALCIMSNHVHYLIEPKQADELPKIMHFLNVSSTSLKQTSPQPLSPLPALSYEERETVSFQDCLLIERGKKILLYNPS